jgi:ribosomal protein S18 acetylase RimI-like enzyme
VFHIERIGKSAPRGDLHSLAQLLLDAVDSNAGVSFLSGLTDAEAETWWRSVLESSSPRAVILVARDADGIAGTVQMQPAWAPNQPHRADIAKLIVHRRGRHAGLGEALMRSIEEDARNAGFTLLTLDAKRGGAAERLYGRLGWTQVGIIPRYAVDTDGQTLHDTVIFFKELG